MEEYYLKQAEVKVPPIVAGCMRINQMETKDLEQWIHHCMETGINHFDHADIYGRGDCEILFGKAVNLRSSIRDKMIIQSKCGIVPGKRFDFSKEYIVDSVDGILSRLQTDYLDFLLLHRPDALVEPEEVAEAFDELKKSGKVRNFGVSNHTVMQIELLRKYVKQNICFNQMQLSIAFAPMISQGIEANMETEGGVGRDGGMIDYSRLNDITIQAWSPFQHGFFEGVFIGNPKYEKLNEVLDELASKYEVSSTTIAAAWILRHPAKIQMIAGTTKVSRMQEIRKAADIRLTRQEWYDLYLAAGHMLP